MAGRRPYAAELSKHEVDILLGLYSGCECLWNMQCPEYTQRNAKQAAFRSIVNGMRLETGIFLTVDQVVAKIRNIRAQYGRELKKTLESDKTGTSYRSHWRWFNFLDSFLRSHFPKKDGDDDPNSEIDHIADKDVEMDGVPAATPPPIKTIAGESDSVEVLDINSDSISDIAAANSSTGALVQNLELTKVKERTPAKPRQPQNHHPVSLRSREPKLRSKGGVAAAAAAASMSYTNVPLAPQTSNRGRKRGRSSSYASPATTVSVTAGDGQQVAHTLHLMQTLMARSLSSQDHPSFVFARHIANELDLIADYRRRKKCMLEIQELILQYQMHEEQLTAGEQERNQAGETITDKDAVADGLKCEEVRPSERGSEDAKRVYEQRGGEFQSDDEDDTPVHFEVPEHSSSSTKTRERDNI